MTERQKLQFNLMLYQLRAFADSKPTEYLKKHSFKEYGISYEDFIEMSYINILDDARDCVRGIREVK